ncbi:MAG TPA: hypothetical protein VF779_02745 [Pyrinomonadaceae bacterium]
MKTFKKFCVASVLILTIMLPISAGQMETGFTDPPPSATPQAATTGDMQAGITGEMSTGVTAIDPVTEVALNLLQNLPPLF